MDGFARPHTPWRVPQRFWDLYTTEDIALAEHKLPPADSPGAVALTAACDERGITLE